MPDATNIGLILLAFGLGGMVSPRGVFTGVAIFGLLVILNNW